jgi:hypothetical protein
MSINNNDRGPAKEPLNKPPIENPINTPPPTEDPPLQQPDIKDPPSEAPQIHDPQPPGLNPPQEV